MEVTMRKATSLVAFLAAVLAMTAVAQKDDNDW
jgi:hypothetical protein